MSRWPSFADWQLSRGIVPWTMVHDWDEWAYQRRMFNKRALRMAKTIGDALLPVMVKAARAADDLVRAWGRFAEVMQSTAERN